MSSVDKISLLNKIIIKCRQVFFSDSVTLWEQRYRLGGNSGQGSYGLLAEYKAKVLNQFVEEFNVKSLVEFGCGDGSQLTLASYPHYVGLDVSQKAITICEEKFIDDQNKKFFLYNPSSFNIKTEQFKAELALSLDVIYHLVEDHIYSTYLTHLFGAGIKYVIIYATDKDKSGRFYERHVRHRNFTKDIAVRFPSWNLIKKIKNKYPAGEGMAEASPADFFIYEAG
jgi:hypothetical protein